MKVMVVVALDVPNTDDITKVLEAIDPPNIPHFAGTVHVVPEPFASTLQDWLEE